MMSEGSEVSNQAQNLERSLCLRNLNQLLVILCFRLSQRFLRYLENELGALIRVKGADALDIVVNHAVMQQKLMGRQSTRRISPIHTQQRICEHVKLC